VRGKRADAGAVALGGAGHGDVMLALRSVMFAGVCTMRVPMAVD
jgi:hypothetical protein